VEVLRQFINVSKEKLMAVRATKVRPGLDHKILAGWNAMMLKAYAKAAMVFGNPEWLEAAEKNAKFFRDNLVGDQQVLLHSCIDDQSVRQSVVRGFLDDYAFVIDAYITLYEATFNEAYLLQAKAWCEEVLTHFSAPSTGLFYYTSDEAETLIARKTEVQDNVISSSNAMMAQVLFLLGKHFEEERYGQRAIQMVLQMKTELVQTTPWYSRWAQVWQQLALPGGEVVFTGPDANRLRDEWMQAFTPTLVIAGSTKYSELPLLRDRLLEISQIFLCNENTCFAPVGSVGEALQYL
jgi:hypothetical protein